MKTKKFNLHRELISFLKSNLSSSFLKGYTFIFHTDSCSIVSQIVISSVMINYLVLFCNTHDLGFYISDTLVGSDFVPAFKIYVRG